jgi:hypothetical protein
LAAAEKEGRPLDSADLVLRLKSAFPKLTPTDREIAAMIVAAIAERSKEETPGSA